MVDEKKCISCGACVAICPVNAIKIEKGKAKINPKTLNKVKRLSCGSKINPKRDGQTRPPKVALVISTVILPKALPIRQTDEMNTATAA